MKLTLAAVGRIGRGPEADLVSDYVARFGKLGRGLGLGPLAVVEVQGRKPGMAAEAEALGRVVPEGAVVCVMDERGAQWSSPQLAQRLAGWRDQGRPAVCFAIGGADGLDPAFRGRADQALSLGPMVWPHMLVRVMLAEQLYRAASILAGSPYHRE